MRRLAALAVLAGGAAPLAAQVELPPGTRVRVVAPALGFRPVETALVRMAGDSLVLQTRPWLPDLAMAPADITRLEVESGRHSRLGTMIGYGIGTGFGVGALLGLSVGSYLTHQDLAEKSDEFGRALVGGLIGAGAGVVIGALIGSVSSETVWSLVDQRDVKLVVRPAPGGAGLSFRLTGRRR